MQAHGLVGRFFLVAGFTAIMAGPALAQRCASRVVDDPHPRGVRTAVNAAVTTAAKPGLAAPNKQAPVVPSAITRNERRKAPATLAAKSVKTVTRAKAVVPHEPAAPGMGSLLKWTAGAARDLSFLFGEDDAGVRPEEGSAFIQ